MPDQAVIGDGRTAGGPAAAFVARFGPVPVAAGALALAAAVYFLTDLVVDSNALLLIFVPAVLVASAVGGLKGGLPATALSLAMSLLDPAAPYDAVRLVIFTVVSCGIAFWGEQLLRQRRHNARMTAELLALTDSLRAREAHHAAIVEAIPEAMIVIDEGGTIHSFSPRAEGLFGYAADEVIGGNVKRLMPNPYRGQHDSYLERYLRTGQKRIIGIGRVVVGERKDGSIFPMELSVGEIRSSRGRAFIGFIRDISERQQAESRLQQLQTELIHISRLSALGEMASALAHELNQPLSAIANYMRGSQRLLEGQSDETATIVREAIDKAAEQSLRAGQIIRRLRDFVARGESDRRLESLAKLIEEAGALALVGAREHGVRVTLQLDDTLDRVVVDRVQIQQVILNLIRNAIEAMQDTERRELVIATAPADEEMVAVSIADTGAGLSPEVLPRLFEPFVSTKAQGMGVGLSISRTIIEAHGGVISAGPNEGGGTVFRFTLRAVREGEAVDAA